LRNTIDRLVEAGLLIRRSAAAGETPVAPQELAALRVLADRAHRINKLAELAERGISGVALIG
jgi:hypothetical protein